MNDTALIRLTSLPVIEEQLRSLKESWEQKAKDAQSLVCTEDTVQDIKKARAEMRKEHDAAETQRKAVKSQYMAPWTQIEKVYKECVEDAYTRADAAYKSKIDEVEDAQKAECEKKCRSYFAELCAVHGVEWLKYEQARLNITLTEAKKKTPSGLFDKLSEFVARVACDIDGISRCGWDDRDDSAEIIAEYKSNCLNMSKAIATVGDRRESAEAERRAAEERAEREKREAEAVAKVEAIVQAAAPLIAIGAPVEAEPLLTAVFKATATREKLIKLREFMKQEGILYE